MKSTLVNTRRPDITFYRSGRIDITTRVTKALALEDGDVIDIAFDGREHLLYVKHKGASLVGRHEAQCRITNRRGKYHNMRAYSGRLCRFVLALNNNADIARLPVGEVIIDPDTASPLLPIIIRNNLPKFPLNSKL